MLVRKSNKTLSIPFFGHSLSNKLQKKDFSSHFEGLGSIAKPYPSHDLSDIAAQFASPCYVYSQSQIEQNIYHLNSAVAKYFDNYRLQYAIKANSNPHIVKIIRDMGMGADCSSPFELELAAKMGFDLSRSCYTGNFESSADLKQIAQYPCVINLDDDSRLLEMPYLDRNAVLSFRVNPGIGRGAFAQIVTGGKEAKFGIPFERIRKAYTLALDLGFKNFGIHMMTGSNILDSEYFALITAKLFDIIEEYLKDLPLQFQFMNIGGGLGVPYREGEDLLDLNDSFKNVSEVFHKRSKDLKLNDMALLMEPGRYIVANAGVLLSRVSHVKHSYRSFVGLDSGMSTLVRPSMYGAYHQILANDMSDSEMAEFRVCGQICESADLHPEMRLLPKHIKAGDLVAIANAGAYGFAMSSQYNHRPRVSELLVTDKGELKQIRKAESFQDLFPPNLFEGL